MPKFSITLPEPSMTLDHPARAQRERRAYALRMLRCDVIAEDTCGTELDVLA